MDSLLACVPSAWVFDKKDVFTRPNRLGAGDGAGLEFWYSVIFSVTIISKWRIPFVTDLVVLPDMVSIQGWLSPLDIALVDLGRTRRRSKRALTFCVAV